MKALKDYRLSEIKAICIEHANRRKQEREQGIDIDKDLCYKCECDAFCFWKMIAPHVWVIEESEDDKRGN